MSETPTENPVVTIYVRLGDIPGSFQHDESVRDISFTIPEGIDPMELLDHGFAIDGRDAGATIAWDKEGEYWEAPFNGSAPSLNGALRNAQAGLVRYFRNRGFEPKFD